MYTEVIKNGYFGRLTKSIGGIFIGILMIIGALILLWTNEGRSFDRQVGLEQAEKAVISVLADQVGEEVEGKLIHTAGLAKGDGILQDEMYGVSTNALKLQRKVEMYQWKEKSSTKTRDELGGSETVTTNYTYEKVWSEQPLNSANFKDLVGHENPDFWPVEKQDYIQNTIKIENIILSGDFTSQINAYQKLSLDSDTLSIQTSTGIIVSQTQVYYGENPATAKIGDVRVTFEIVPSMEVSIIGEYRAGKVLKYITENNSSIALLAYGNKTDTDMILTAKKENTTLTWVLRAVGMLLLFIGFKLLLAPIVIIAKIVPFVSRIIGAGTSLIAGALTLILGGVTIALAWFATRPLVSGVILALVGVVVGYLWYKNKNIQK